MCQAVLATPQTQSAALSQDSLAYQHNLCMVLPVYAMYCPMIAQLLLLH